MESPLPTPTAARLEKESEPTGLFFVSALSWLDKLIKYKRFRRTRRYIKEGQQLFDLPADEISRLEVMGPWSFKTYEIMLAALPGEVIGAIISFIAPYEPSAQLSDNLSQHQVAFVRDYLRLEPSISKIIWPVYIPTLLLISSSIVSRGSLRKEDSTRQSRKRARNAYLYYDAAYGLGTQTLLSLLLAVMIASYQRGWGFGTTPFSPAIYILTIPLFVAAMVNQIYISLGTVANRLFRLNGYATGSRSTVASSLIPAPRFRYVFFVYLAGYLNILMVAVFVSIEIVALVILVRLRFWIKGSSG
jgi:hypothetical protein